MSDTTAIDPCKLELGHVKPSFPPTYWVLPNFPTEVGDSSTGQNYIRVPNDGVLWVDYSWGGDQQPSDSPYVFHMADGSKTPISKGENYIDVNDSDTIVYYNIYTVKLQFQVIESQANQTPPPTYWLLDDDAAEGKTSVVVPNSGILWIFYEWSLDYTQPPPNAPYVSHNGGGVTPIAPGENRIAVNSGDTFVFYNEYIVKFAFQMINT